MSYHRNLLRQILMLLMLDIDLLFDNYESPCDVLFEENSDGSVRKKAHIGMLLLILILL